MRTTAILTALGAMFAPCAVVHAATAFFNYTQTDAATGAGTLTADINTTPFGGPGLLTFTGVMPAGLVSSVYGGSPAVPSYAVGAIDTLLGENFGVHVGWNDNVTISNVDPNTSDTWAVQVPLIQVANGEYHWIVDFVEDPDAGFDFQTVDGAAGSTANQARFAMWLGDYQSGHRETNARMGFEVYSGDPNDIESFRAEEATTPGSDSFGDNLGINGAIRSGVMTLSSGPLLVDQIFYEGPVLTDNTTMTLNGTPKPKLPILPTDVFSLVLDIGPASQRLQAGHTGLPDPNDGSTPANGASGSPAGILIDTGTGSLFTVSINNVDHDDDSTGNIDWHDRGDASGGAMDLVQLGEDFIFNDNGIVRLTFEDLPPGEYDAVSYHVDSNILLSDPFPEPADDVRAFVDNSDGAGFVEKGSIVGRTLDLGGVDNLTTMAVEDSSISFSFTSDGLNPVIILFDSTPDPNAFPSGCGTDPDEDFCEAPLNGLSLSYTPGFPGDVDGDEIVDDVDRDIIRMNFFKTEVGGLPVEKSDGDLNLDNIVDFLDYRLWKFFVPVPLAASSATVPEPASLAMLLLGGAALLGIRRRVLPALDQLISLENKAP